MNYQKLSVAGPEVSKLCLGTGGFGTAVPREEAFAQMDRFLGKGGNFFDSARVYADWVPGGHGASEKTLGAWIKDRKIRDRVVIATKGAHPDLKTMNVPRMSPGELRSDLDESLKTLGTGYIDIYLLHRDDVSRPVEEILATLETFKKEGKILHYGCSNWTLARMEEAEKVASRRGFEGFMCNQIRFSLGDISLAGLTDKTVVAMDRDIYTWHRETNKAVMAYTSSCNGWFSKKLLGKPLSPGQEAVYDNGSNRKLLEKLRLWEKEYGVSAAVLVSSFVMTQDFPSVPISSFSSVSQLEELVTAADFSFPPEALERIWGIKEFIV
ncbi:MAG: aldo/keto reductase [Treponema sp.]|jgi:aryl-alcohol dehydrogenase-like predicted oxidoreductase|nr:aldo/keto reductase [Treponema sp.]